MFILAYPEDADHIAYFDKHWNKYIAAGGTLAWRLNNPGLVHSRSHVARKNGSIGSFGLFAIFPSPEQGHLALSDWLRLKTHHKSTLKTIARRYQSSNPEEFVLRLQTLTDLPEDQKIASFSARDFEALLRAIEKTCHYSMQGNEEFTLLPKISGKIENGDQEETYLLGNDIILSKSEAIEWIESYRLDAAVVREANGRVYLRSRPHHTFANVRAVDADGLTSFLSKQERLIESLAKTVGEKQSGQCIWGFINGISNSPERARKSAGLISSTAGGEAVFSLSNHTALYGILDIPLCLVLKLGIDTPIIALAVSFFHYLLALSHQETQNDYEPPIIIFAHSEGAIVCERVLEHLTEAQRGKLRIFTFGGGSFILPGKSHPDSHNYASAADLVCRAGSPNHQILALIKYEWHKEGLTQEEIIRRLAMRDAYLHLDSIDSTVIEAYADERSNFYRNQFAKISNVTVLAPDSGVSLEHAFVSRSYQTAILSIIKKYQAMARKRTHVT